MVVEESGQQKKTPEKLPLRADIPSPSMGLNKRIILLAASVLAIAIGVVFLNGMSSEKPARDYKARMNWNPQPGEAVMELPGDYDERKRQEKKKERKEVFKNEARIKSAPLRHLPDEDEKILSDYELKRLKNAIKAREGDLSFKMTDRSYEKRELSREKTERVDSFPNTLRFKTENSGRLEEALSSFTLYAGTVIPGLLITGINSDLPGPIVGQVSQNVYDSVSGRYLLLPQGSKVIGHYDNKVAYGQERVLIIWSRIILPDGKSISLDDMPGVDMSGYSGLKDRVNNHYGRLITGVVLGSIIGAGAQVAHGDYQNVNPDFGQLALQGAAQNMNEAGQRITERNLNVPPTIEISPGFRFNIFVTKDIVLERYAG